MAKKPWETDSVEPEITTPEPTPIPVQEVAEEPELIEHDPGILQMIVDWNDATTRLAALKEREMELRIAIAQHYFPKPKEGTNKHPLPDQWQLDCKVPFYRNVDKAALPAVLEKMPEGSEDKLIRYKPELQKAVYNALPDVQKEILDQALTIKPGTPSLTLHPPKE